nr:pathogenesis-related protein 1A-like [Ipomoea batatas]
MSLCCNAQNSPQDYLDAHNAARAAVGVGPMTWDASAAAYAQNYANIRSGDCSLTHSNSFQFGYGENLAAGGGPLTGKQIEDFTSVIVSVAPSRMSSNRNPMESPAEHSRQASRRPQGFQVPSPGRRMSQAPGFDLLTLSLPGEGTNGVTIDAAATGEPDRSWMGPISAVSETEFTGENRLLNIPVDLKHLRTTLGFAVKLKNKSRVGFRLHVQVEHRRRTRNRNPTRLKHKTPTSTHTSFQSLQIQNHHHAPQSLPALQTRNAIVLGINLNAQNT